MSESAAKSVFPSVPGENSGQVPYTGTVEIRLHGVSGTPPEELLGRERIQQVAGDATCGFYRPTDSAQMRDQAEGAASGTAKKPAPGPWLEGYSWGGWTSGVRSRALWLILVPFALINVSSRMLPPDSADHQPSHVSRLAAAALLRAIALSVTLTLIYGIATISMVTVALRCGIDGACHGMPERVTAVLSGLPLHWRVALCMLVPIAAVIMLYLVSRTTSYSYEEAWNQHQSTRPDDDEQPLRRPDMWQAGLLIGRLRLVHVLVSLVAVLGIGAYLLDGGTARIMALVFAAITFVAGIAIVASRPRAPWTPERRAIVMLPARLLWVGVAGACGAFFAQLIDLGARLTRAEAAGKTFSALAGCSANDHMLAADCAVRRVDQLWLWLFMGQSALLFTVLALIAASLAWKKLIPLLLVTVAVIIAIAGWVLASESWSIAGASAVILFAGLWIAGILAGRQRGGQLFVGGFSAFVMATVGWLTSVVFTASVLIVVPAWFAREGFAFTPWQIGAALGEPATAGWFGPTSRSAGIGTLVAVVFIAIMVAQLYVRSKFARWFPRDTRADVVAVESDYEPELVTRLPGRAAAIRMTFWWARRVDRIPRALAVFCASVAVLLALQGIALLYVKPGAGAGSGSWAAAVLGRSDRSCEITEGTCGSVGVVAWGVFLTAGIAIGFVAFAVLAYRRPAMRRVIGVLWDLSCFWPRDTHPFAPPCYNERIMPQVSARVKWYLGSDGKENESDICAEETARPEPSAEDTKSSTTVNVGAAAVVKAGDNAAESGAAVRDSATDLAVERGQVILAGHSQGSVIALTAALIQTPFVQQRLSLLTCGCVLDRLYARFFPRYFNEEIFTQVAQNLDGRWVNIWRHSDFIGGSVPYPPEPHTPDAPDLHDLSAHKPEPHAHNVKSIDPQFCPPPGEWVYPQALKHSDYWDDPVFYDALHWLQQ